MNGASLGAENATIRTCPFCHAETEADVSLCSHCGRFSKTESRVVRSSIPSKISDWIGSGELKHSWIKISLDRVSQFNVVISKRVRVAIVTIIALLVILPFTRGLGIYGTAYWIIRSLFEATLGYAVWKLFGPREAEALKRRDTQNDVCPDHAVKFLAYCSNLVLAQAVLLIISLVELSQDQYDSAWTWAWITTAISVPLVTTSRRVLVIVMGVASTCMLVYIHQVYSTDLLGYTIRQGTGSYGWGWSLFTDPLITILQIMTVIAIFPQLQVIRTGRVGIGRLRGDFQIKMLGTMVPIALGSAVIILALHYTLDELRTLPDWLGFYG